MAPERSARASLAPYDSYPLQELLRRTARSLPAKTAVIDGERTFTYQQLDVYSDRFATALAGLGVEKGDHIGLLIPNCVEFVIAFYGILKTGAVASTINSGYREREIAHQINDSGSGILIVHETLLRMAEAARGATPGLKRLIIINTNADDANSFWGLIEHATPTPPTIAIDPKEDLAALPYSSGTTGLSKGVMLTHYNLTTNLRQFLEFPGQALSYGADDVTLVHLPLFHIYGLQVLMNGAIASGATQVMMGRFDMERLLQLLAQHGITHLNTVPPVGVGLTLYPGVANHDLSALKIGFLGAAPSSAELQSKVSGALGIPVLQGYGMTELSPVANIDYLEPDRARPGSVGPAVADTEERVVDLETGTRDVASEELGELLVRGPQVMKGYHNNAAATRETITADGWLRTGDIVRMDDDGYVWVLDRKKELIKYKGFQVPPAELEALLLAHPAVADAAVIGKKGPETGEIPKAFVVRKPGSEVSDADLMGFVAGRVATYKQIREVEFVDTIPKNPSGKILRRLLIEQERTRGGDEV